MKCYYSFYAKALQVHIRIMLLFLVYLNRLDIKMTMFAL